MSENNSINRRDFVKTAGIAAASALLSNALPVSAQTTKKRRYAIVGTGHRAASMRGIDLANRYEDELEFVGAMSCLTGIAARTSIEQNRPVKISELVKL